MSTVNGNGVNMSHMILIVSR